MHWICDSLRADGWDTRFITCDFSWITQLKGDRRTAYGKLQGLNSLVRIDENLSVAVVHTPFHPLGNGKSILGKALSAATSLYPQPKTPVVRAFADGADLVIIESCGALLMVEAIRNATDAPIVYRVSDNLRVVRPVPCLLRAEADAAREVDAVSLASENLAMQFQGSDNVRLDPMGLDKALFDECSTSPYRNDGRVKVVISGSSGLDVLALKSAAECLPDFDFIQFGAAEELPNLPNVIYKGETPFRDLVPWVKFADIGFAPYKVRLGFEYQAEHSNRLLQYTYSGLPSVVPKQLAHESKAHFIGYDVNVPQSIREAFLHAKDFDRRRVPKHSVLNWIELARRLATVSRRR